MWNSSSFTIIDIAPSECTKSDLSDRFDPDAHIGFAAVREREVGNQLRGERLGRRLVGIQTVGRFAHRRTIETGQTQLLVATEREALAGETHSGQ